MKNEPAIIARRNITDAWRNSAGALVWRFMTQFLLAMRAPERTANLAAPEQACRQWRL